MEPVALFLGPQPISSAARDQPLISSLYGVGVSYLDSAMADNQQIPTFAM